MQTAHFWYQFDLRRSKIGLITLFLTFLTIGSANAQGLFGLTSTSGSDDKLLSYGFFLAGHTSTYRLKYADRFVQTPNTAGQNVRAIFPKYTPGFSLGFIGMLRFHDQMQLLFTPKIGFYEFRTEVQYFSDDLVPDIPNPDEPVSPAVNVNTLISESTMIELPLLLKYRSQRFNNTRMYFIGGASYMFRTKTQDEANLEDLVTVGQDYTIELGMGFEVYFRYFKFAPEIRFSHGLNNLYQPENTIPEIRDAISSIKRKSVTIYLNFQ